MHGIKCILCLRLVVHKKKKKSSEFIDSCYNLLTCSGILASWIQRWGSNPNISDILNREKLQLDSSWLEQWMEECSWKDGRRDSSYNDNKSRDKILEVDTWKPDPKSRRLHHNSSTKPQKSFSCQSFRRAPSSLSSPHFPFDAHESAVYTADSSPQPFASLTRHGGSSSRRSILTSLTPPRTDGSPNFFSDHPKYMAKTQSSQAKVRSQSSPRLRPDYDNSASSKRSFHGCWDPNSSPNKITVNRSGRSGSGPGSLDRVWSSTRSR